MTASTAAIENAAVTAQPHASTRRLWVDCFKGICIVLVVVGHVIGGLVAARVVPADSALNYLRSWVYLFHMPAFFFASGLFAGRGIQRTWGDFLRSRCSSIVYPYCLWTAIVLGSQVLCSRITNSPPDLQKGMRFLIEPYGYGLWFLYALLVISVLFQLGGKLGFPRTFLLASAVMLTGLAMRQSFDFWPILNTSLSFLIYFVCGAVFSREANTWLANLGSRVSFPVAALLLTVMTFASQFASFGSVVPIAIAFLGIAGLVALAKAAVAAGVNSVWSSIGGYSLEIYLGHILLSTLPRPLLRAAGVGQPLIFVCCGVGVGLIGSIGLGFLTRRVRFPWLYRWPSAKTSRFVSVDAEVAAGCGGVASLKQNRSGGLPELAPEGVGSARK